MRPDDAPFRVCRPHLAGTSPDWSWLIRSLSALGNASLLLCAFVFPDGRFVPPWTRGLAFLLLGYSAVVAVFSTVLRNEVDLDQLREHLVAVVQETMQPAHVSLWLSRPEPSLKRNTRVLPRRRILD